MSEKVQIVVEVVNQPPFETRASVFHKSYEVESDDLAAVLRGGSARVIAAYVTESESNDDTRR